MTTFDNWQDSQRSAPGRIIVDDANDTVTVSCPELAAKVRALMRDITVVVDPDCEGGGLPVIEVGAEEMANITRMLGTGPSASWWLPSPVSTRFCTAPKRKYSGTMLFVR